MNDNEIIKALEAHFEKEQVCRNCPFNEDGDCCVTLLENAFDLINRQKADIERLQTELVATRYSENAFKEENRRLVKLKKADVIKEFAERLKENEGRRGVPIGTIDRLVKEMTENEGKV